MMTEELLTVHEVAKRLRVDPTSVRRWIRDGVLEAIELPHRGNYRGYRIKRSVLERVLQNAAEPEQTTR